MKFYTFHLKRKKDKCSSLLNEIDVLKIENDNLMKRNAELVKVNEGLENVLQDSDELHVFEDEAGKFTNEFVQCAINLTILKVASKNVGPIIEEVGKLFGKKINQVPTRQTVVNFNDRKISLLQKQIGVTLSTEKHLTLYTDETRKHGHTYETYIISDNEQNSYLLGLREMANKSGQSTLDTLKEILNGISDHCKSADNESVGSEMIANIKTTMSDRASTEKHFNT